MKSPSSDTISTDIFSKHTQNLTAWVVAGSLAYFFYVVPEQKRAKEQHEARELARKLAAEQGWPDRVKMRPIPDPQTNGLIIGKGKG